MAGLSDKQIHDLLFVVDNDDLDNLNADEDGWIPGNGNEEDDNDKDEEVRDQNTNVQDQVRDPPFEDDDEEQDAVVQRVQQGEVNLSCIISFA